MKLTQPTIESPITREELESIGLHYIGGGQIQVFSGVPFSEQLTRKQKFRIELYGGSYISLKVNEGLFVPMSVSWYFRNIQHFIDTCVGLGIEF